MKKNNTNYFSHDCNARDDDKIMLLRAEYGWEGYGIWWLVVEKLSEATDFKLLISNKVVISKLYIANIEVINYLFKIGLLIEEGNYMYAPSLLKRMSLKTTALEKMREGGRKAMQKRRGNHKVGKKTENNITPIVSSDKVLITSKVKESKVKENNIKKDNTLPSKFIKPNIEEIKQYCLERKNKINPKSFLDFYESKGWMVGKNKMKDWKACMRTWESRDDNKSNNTKQQYENDESRENFNFMGE